MRSFTIAGRHHLANGHTADVTVNGNLAEVRGSNADGQATYTVSLPVSRVVELLAGVERRGMLAGVSK